MKKYWLAIILTSCTMNHALAQNAHADSLIYLHGFNWKIADTKLSSSQLKAEISKTPEALPSLKKGRTNAKLSMVFFTGAALFSLASILNSDNNHYYTRTGRKFSYNVLAASSFIAGIITLKYSLRNKGKAVHLRNLDMIN